MSSIVLPYRSAPPAFLQRTAGTTTATGAVNGTYTTITFNTAQLSNDLGVMDAPSNTQLRALVAGTYRIYYNMMVSSGTNNKSWEARLLKNGTTDLTGSHSTVTVSAACQGSLIETILVDLAANDYVEAQVTPRSATATTVQIGSQFRMELVKFN